jgi:hypothetical protein
MRDDVIKQRQTWRTATAAAIAGLAVLAAATGAQAHDEERKWKHHGRYFVPPGPVYYSAPPVYYAPRYYAPQPMGVYPAPVYYDQAPAYYPPPGLTINIPLR